MRHRVPGQPLNTIFDSGDYKEQQKSWREGGTMTNTKIQLTAFFAVSFFVYDKSFSVWSPGDVKKGFELFSHFPCHIFYARL
jgi:hypothetical protein